jgi:hypothetical protein
VLPKTVLSTHGNESALFAGSPPMLMDEAPADSCAKTRVAASGLVPGFATSRSPCAPARFPSPATNSASSPAASGGGVAAVTPGFTTWTSVTETFVVDG